MISPVGFFFMKHMSKPLGTVASLHLLKRSPEFSPKVPRLSLHQMTISVISLIPYGSLNTWHITVNFLPFLIKNLIAQFGVITPCFNLPGIFSHSFPPLPCPPVLSIS